MSGTRPPRGPGGVAAELGAVDPRQAIREKAPRDIREKPRGSKGKFRPGADPGARSQTRYEPADEPDPYDEALNLQPRAGKRGRTTGNVRVYHRVYQNGEWQRCWAFTITRAAYERLRSERILDHDGATYPDGRPVVPEGRNPLDYPVACGSCGTTSVECLQIEFLED